MLCDVDVDVGRRMVFGSEERREQMEKQRRKREKRTEIMRERREKFRGEKWKFFFFFLQYCYSAIPPLELHCSSIAKKFAILKFCIP